MIWLNLWFLPRAFFVARGPWVAASTRHSLRPPIVMRVKSRRARALSPRREDADLRQLFDRLNQNSNRGVIARRLSAEAIQTIPAERFWIASLRSQ